MAQWHVIYEQADDGSWSASVTHLPVFSHGETLEEAEANVREAIALYLDFLRERGEEVPEPRIVSGTVEV